jgi:hypothetical protein
MKRAMALFWGTSKSGSKNIEAGKRITVLAFSQLGREGLHKCPDDDRDCFQTQLCENGVSFVPEQGHHYTVTQHAALDSHCPMHIVDDATQSTPPSVQHDFHDFCTGL